MGATVGGGGGGGLRPERCAGVEVGEADVGGGWSGGINF